MCELIQPMGRTERPLFKTARVMVQTYGARPTTQNYRP